MAMTTEHIDRAKRPSTDDALARDAMGLLALQALPRVGPKTALRAAFSSASFASLRERHEAAWPAALVSARETLEECDRREIKVLGFFDEDYPKRILEIHDPPPVLFLRGSLDVLSDERMVAVIGTREPTSFGREAAVRLSTVLASARWGVVSGLARGVDTLAHAVALERGVSTVAVMAGGLDSVYPPENAKLASTIVDSGGALIAEVPPGVRPRRSHFVARDRLQTALATAVVVAQTGIEGGTMHTVRYAAAQGKPVFCAQPLSAHEQDAGLSVLLDTPARMLCDRLPAWAGARRLCMRLGSQPLASGVSQGDLEQMLDGLEFALQSEQALWRPTSGLVADQQDDDYVATGYDECSSLLALID
jgi:DNA processing protein